jgi:hypothetical protein
VKVFVREAFLLVVGNGFLLLGIFMVAAGFLFFGWFSAACGAAVLAYSFIRYRLVPVREIYASWKGRVK